MKNRLAITNKPAKKTQKIIKRVHNFFQLALRGINNAYKNICRAINILFNFTRQNQSQKLEKSCKKLKNHNKNDLFKYDNLNFGTLKNKEGLQSTKRANNKTTFLTTFVKIIVFTVATASLLVNPYTKNNQKFFNAYAEDDLPAVIEEELKNLDLSALEKFILDNDVEGFDFKKFVKDAVSGKLSIEYEDFSSYFLSMATSPVKKIAPSFIYLIVISVVCGILTDFINGNGISDSVRLAVSCFFAFIILGVAENCFETADKALESANGLLSATSPVLLTLMIAGGGNVSAGIFKPVVAVFANIITVVSADVLFQIVKAVFILNLTESISADGRFTGISSFFKSLVKWITGFTFGIFSFFLTVNGIAGASYDGITLKATKYAVGSSVPIIGGYVSGGLELIVYASVLIKNAVGIGTLFLILCVIASPVLKIATVSLLFKFTGGIIGALSDKKSAELCGELSKTFSLLAVILTAIGIVFFIIIFLLITTASNMAV